METEKPAKENMVPTCHRCPLITGIHRATLENGHKMMTRLSYPYKSKEEKKS